MIIGIHVDNYKLDTFIKELDLLDFKDREVTNFSKETKLIKIKTEEHRFNSIRKMCARLEINLKRSN